MAVNKVVINRDGTEETLIDLTSDTATASNVANGYTFHRSDGVLDAGTLKFANVYSGTGEPDSSLGNDGDIYMVVNS